MADALEKVDGIIDERGNREKWSSWLVPGGEDEYKKIKSPRLKALVRDLARRPDELTPIEKLSDFHDQFMKLKKTLNREAKVQALDYIDKIAKRAFELASRQTPPEEKEKGRGRSPRREIPKSPEQQRAFVRELLDQIEQNDLETYHFQNVDAVNEIMSILPRVDEEVQIEANARLRLQDCSIGMKAALSGGGDTRDSGGKPVIGGLFKEKYAELNSKGRLMDGDDLNGLFQSLPGIDVGEAYVELQKAALLGKDIGKRRPVKIFEKGSSEEEQKAVYKKIVSEMGGGKGAEKAVQLGMRFAWASLEASVWNNDLLGVDPLAEAIYFRQYREGRAQQGKDRGPEETIKFIEGFGSSFLRTASFSDKSPVFAARRRDIDARQEYIWRIRGVIDRDPAVNYFAFPDPRQIDFSKTEPNAYGLYMSVRVPQILTVKSLLLKDDWTPEDILPDSVRSWLSPLQFVDGEGILSLRYYHIGGVLGSSFRNVQRAIQLKWGYTGLQNTESALTETLGTDEGHPVSYLSKKQWKELIKWTNAYTTATLADASRALLGIRT